MDNPWCPTVRETTLESQKEHWLHKWAGTVATVFSILAVVAGGAAAWTRANTRIDRLNERVGELETAVKKLHPEPTAHEKQCEKILAEITLQLGSTFSNHLTELRQLAAEMKCVPGGEGAR